MNYLFHRYGISPDAISGKCTSSPLFINEIEKQTDTPVIYNTAIDAKDIMSKLNIKASKSKMSQR